MIGDTLTFTRAYPTVNSEWAVWNPSHVSTTVTRLMRTDQLIWRIGGRSFNRIDPGADLIQWDFVYSPFTSYGGPDFDGYTFTGFSHDIATARVVSNDSGAAVTLGIDPRRLTRDREGSVSPPVVRCCWRAQRASASQRGGVSAPRRHWLPQADTVGAAKAISPRLTPQSG